VWRAARRGHRHSAARYARAFATTAAGTSVVIRPGRTLPSRPSHPPPSHPWWTDKRGPPNNRLAQGGPPLPMQVSSRRRRVPELAKLGSEIRSKRARSGGRLATVSLLLRSRRQRRPERWKRLSTGCCVPRNPSGTLAHNPAITGACSIGANIAGMTTNAEGRPSSEPYYRGDLALVHHRGFAFHAEQSIERALVAIASALKPGGLLAFDICDLEWGRRGVSNLGRAGADWAIITEFSVPSPDRFIREMTTFLANGDGTWRRDDERHENVLIDTAAIPSLLSAHGVDAEVRGSFGSESLPPGLHVVLGRRPI
jgi:hypothetical protein